MTGAPPAPKHALSDNRWWPRAAAIVALPVWGSVSFFCLGLLLFSAMLFDAPGSEDNPWLWCMVGALAATPALSVLTAIVSVAALVMEARRPWPAWVIYAAALAPALGGLLFVVGIVGINVACDGSFSCGY